MSVWSSLAGKLVSYAMFQRARLIQLDAVYKKNSLLYAIHTRLPPPTSFRPKPTQLREVQSIISLLPLAQVHFDLPISLTLIAFDASRIAGAVVYTILRKADALLV